mgnify:FL=1
MASLLRLDLNYPAFQRELFEMEAGEFRAVARNLRKLSSMTWNDVYADHGLKGEAVRSMPGRFTIRLSQKFRAVVAREGDFIRFMALHPDHDGAYRR